jgi:hypothetical protein
MTTVSTLCKEYNSIPSFFLGLCTVRYVDNNDAIVCVVCDGVSCFL